jgi:hypothetical protein
VGEYDRQIATAQRLIRDKGELSTLLRVTPTAAGGTPWRPGAYAAPAELPVGAVWLNYNLRDSGSMDAPESLIKVGDKKVLVAAVDVPGGITVSDRLRRVDGTVYNVENVKLLDPNGQAILYELQVRQ